MPITVTPLNQEQNRDFRESMRDLTSAGVIRTRIRRHATTGMEEMPPTPSYAHHSIGTQALLIPFSQYLVIGADPETNRDTHNFLSYQVRKICSEFMCYPVELTSDLTDSNNFQTKLLSEDQETLRTSAACLVFPRVVSSEVIALVNHAISVSEANLKETLLELYHYPASMGLPYIENDLAVAFPPLAADFISGDNDSVCSANRTGPAYVANEPAVFFPQTASDIEGIESVCQVNRIYEVVIKGGPHRNKVSVSIECGPKGQKTKTFLAPLPTITLSNSSLKLKEAKQLISDSEAMLLSEIKVLVENPEETPESDTSWEPSFHTQEVPELMGSPLEEVQLPPTLLVTPSELHSSVDLQTRLSVLVEQNILLEQQVIRLTEENARYKDREDFILAILREAHPE